MFFSVFLCVIESMCCSRCYYYYYVFTPEKQQIIFIISLWINLIVHKKVRKWSHRAKPCLEIVFHCLNMYSVYNRGHRHEEILHYTQAHTSTCEGLYHCHIVPYILTLSCANVTLCRHECNSLHTHKV